MFGSDAAAVEAGNPQKNARIIVATYQSLDVDRDESEAKFLVTHYQPNYFSHIIIDECHRSAWGKWSEVLKRNPEAFQVGLTATPRTLPAVIQSNEARMDAQINADNVAWFGEPVYEYDMAQGRVLKEHLVRGYSVNEQRLRELRTSLRLVKNVVDRIDVTSDETRALLAVVSDYAYALDLLDDFDHRRISVSEVQERPAVAISYDEALTVVEQLKRKFHGSDLFGKEKDESLKGSLGAIMQTFGGRELRERKPSPSSSMTAC